MRLASTGTVCLALRIIVVTFSPFKRDRAARPRFSVSPACHGSPETMPEAPGNTILAAEGANLDEAFRAHSSELLRYLRRHAGDDAADIMQDVFARAAGSPQRNKILNPGGFLRRVAQNLLIDRARKRKRDNVVLFPLQEERDAISPPEQEHRLQARDLLRAYEQAVEAMPEKTRRVFLMRRVDGLSYREIQEKLGISVATVEYHMVRALGQLSDALEFSR